MPAYNERFYESGGVCPQKHLCEFGSLSPARTFVKPAAFIKPPPRWLQCADSVVEKVSRAENGVQFDNRAELRTVPKTEYEPTNDLKRKCSSTMK
jgi:hypothetical protein